MRGTKERHVQEGVEASMRRGTEGCAGGCEGLRSMMHTCEGHKGGMSERVPNACVGGGERLGSIHDVARQGAKQASVAQQGARDSQAQEGPQAPTPQAREAVSHF